MRCEEEFLEYLEKLVRGLDRRINRGKDRLKRSMEAKQRVCSEGGLWGGGSNIEGWERGSSYCLERVCLFSCVQVLHGESSSTTESTRRMNIEINAKVMEVAVCVFLVPCNDSCTLTVVSCPAGAAGGDGAGGGGTDGDAGVGGA